MNILQMGFGCLGGEFRAVLAQQPADLQVVAFGYLHYALFVVSEERIWSSCALFARLVNRGGA